MPRPAKNSIQFSTIHGERSTVPVPYFSPPKARSTAKNASAKHRPKDSRFARTAIGGADYVSLTPEQRRDRNRWLADSKAREAQLVSVAGQGLYAAADDIVTGVEIGLCQTER